MQSQNKVIILGAFIYLLMLLLIGQPVFAQNQRGYDSVLNAWGSLSPQFNQADIMLPIVSVKPAYPGGHPAWTGFIKQQFNKRIPFANQVRPGSYRVIIRFTVGRDSVLRNIGAESNCGYGLETELIRCFKACSLWHPARSVTNEQVSFTMRQLVTFVIKSNDIDLIISEPNTYQ